MFYTWWTKSTHCPPTNHPHP